MAGVKNYPQRAAPKGAYPAGSGFTPALGNTSGVAHYPNPPSATAPHLGDEARIRASFKNTKHPTSHCRTGGGKGMKGGY